MDGCAVVWTSLPGPAQVESVLLGNEAAVLSAMTDGAVLVDTTTNDPDVARRVADAAPTVHHNAGRPGQRPPTHHDHDGRRRPHGVRKSVAVPGSGGRADFYVGPAGAGCVAKLATQYMGYTNLIAAIEGMLIAKLGGVDPPTWPTSSRSAPAPAGRSTQSPVPC